MKHPELLWNPKSKEWFCTRCFKASDHLRREDAEIELNQYDCIVADGSESAKSAPVQ